MKKCWAVNNKKYLTMLTCYYFKVSVALWKTMFIDVVTSFTGGKWFNVTCHTMEFIIRVTKTRAAFSYRAIFLLILLGIPSFTFFLCFFEFAFFCSPKPQRTVGCLLRYTTIWKLNSFILCRNTSPSRNETINSRFFYTLV